MPEDKRFFAAQAAHPPAATPSASSRRHPPQAFAVASSGGAGGANASIPAHLRRGRSLLVLTQDNQYKLSAPPADPHGARSPSRDAWKGAGGAAAATSAHAARGSHNRAEAATQQEQVPAVYLSQGGRHQGGSRPVKRFSFRAGGGGLAIDARSRQLSRRLSSFGITEGNIFGSLATNTSPDEPPPGDYVLQEPETGGKTHLHSADLFERSSPLQRVRRAWQCTLPSALESQQLRLVECECPLDHDSLCQSEDVKRQLKAFFPATFGKKYVELVPSMTSGPSSPREPQEHALSKALRIGIVLSGGPAPGGHNVIAGLFDFVKQRHPESMLVGFMGGLDGVMNQNYTASGVLTTSKETWHHFIVIRKCFPCDIRPLMKEAEFK
ncbi:hypothetical protein Emag_007471 [Eimeria magna]